MVGSFLDWITTELLPGFISFLGSLYIVLCIELIGKFGCTFSPMLLFEIHLR